MMRSPAPPLRRHKGKQEMADRKLWFVNYEQMMAARKHLGFADLETRL